MAAADPVILGAGAARLYLGDCLEVLPALEGVSVDAIVTDPPYELKFMSRGWDGTGIAFRPETWQAALCVLKPGGYMLAFGGTRTYHRLACAIEDAGFYLTDCLMWLWGSGFPKGKGQLKPAWSPILLARRPGAKVLPLGVDGCRVPATDDDRERLVEWHGKYGGRDYAAGTVYEINHGSAHRQISPPHPAGRWPANLILDEEAAALLDEQSGERKSGGAVGRRSAGIYKHPDNWRPYHGTYTRETVDGLPPSTGGASRFFFCPKASRAERGEGNAHPTVKPLELCRWLVRLVCPPGGLVLDPFAGSATTGVACIREGFGFVGVEREPAYFTIAERRLREALSAGPLFQEGA